MHRETQTRVFPSINYSMAGNVRFLAGDPNEPVSPFLKLSLAVMPRTSTLKWVKLENGLEAGNYKIDRISSLDG